MTTARTAKSPQEKQPTATSSQSLDLQIPVQHFADQVGELNVGAFVSRIVFTTVVPGKATQNQTAVAAITIPTNSLLKIASTIMDLLTREDVKNYMKTSYEEFSTNLDSRPSPQVIKKR